MKSIGIRRALKALLAIPAVGFAVIAYVYLTLPDVRPLASVNPATTAFMELRARDAAAQGRPLRHEQRWIPYTRISPHLKRAVLVAEDDAFWEHEGVDLEQLRDAMQADLARGKAVRGASTITQQLAKNLYLSPSRDPLRKLRELIIARRLEAALPKARILELYLNLIEWGDGVWGAEAAARRYFGVSASALGPDQSALLAGAIINPRVYSPARPNARLLRRQKIILARMGTVTPPAPEPIPVLEMGPSDHVPTPKPFPTPDREEPPASEVPADPAKGAGETPSDIPAPAEPVPPESSPGQRF